MRIRKAAPWVSLGVVCVLGFPAMAQAQGAGQLWVNATFDWLASERLVYEIDLQPTTQLITSSGQPTWFAVDATPHVEYAVMPWMEILGEVGLGLKNQSDETNSTTVAPRVGVQLHLLSQLLQAHAPRGADRERRPRRRLITNALLRLEHEQTSYSTDAPLNSTWHFRHRADVAYPINRAKTTVDGAVYLTWDGELFMPLDRAPNDAVVDQLRVRTGLGYRRSFAWRFEALYVWNARRHQDGGALAVDSHAVDIRVKHDF